MNKYAFLFLAVVIPDYAAGSPAEQAPLVTDVRQYEWETTRDRYDVSMEDARHFPAILLKTVQAHEYAYENSSLVVYSLTHKIIRVNNDDGIRAYNKIYIPTHNILDVAAIKARSISPTGKIVDVDARDIKELREDEESGYKIFAIEAVEKGSEIEYYYISKEEVGYFGRDYFQYSIPSRDNHFYLISPANLKFAAKGYNGFPDCKEETIDGKRILHAHVEEIDDLQEEAFSFYNANRMRVEFKLEQDTFKGAAQLLTWHDAAHHIYANVYQLEKKQKKEIAKWFRRLKLDKDAPTEEKVREIENHIKTNFFIQEGYNPELYDVSSVLSNKFGNVTGMVRLFAAVFDEAGVPFEVVMTSDRSNVKFDKDFESWNYLEQYAFYFPELDKYLSPERFDYRYGMLPYEITHNYGLFVKPVAIGKYNTALGNVRFIEASEHDKNYDDLDIAIRFAPDMNKTDIGISRKMGGYSGAYIQPFYSYLQEDKKREIAETLVKMSAEDAKFNELEIKNGEENLSPLIDPFTVNADIESSSLIEKAGAKYLFKFGKIIGPQTELYQEEDRQSDVENDFNRSYKRKITLQTPKDFIVKNLEDIRMDVFFEKNNERVFSFKSDYKQEGDRITVMVEEFYKEIECSKKHFNEFRKVINAAADFNKVTLILEKK